MSAFGSAGAKLMTDLRLDATAVGRFRVLGTQVLIPIPMRGQEAPAERPGLPCQPACSPCPYRAARPLAEAWEPNKII